MRKLSILISLVLIMAVLFAVPVAAAQRATVDMARVTSTGEGEPGTGFTPDAIFDGDEFTRWGSMQAGESVTAAFTQEYYVEALEIRFFRAGVREHLFLIEYSTDGTNWSTIESTKPHSTADPSLEMFGEEDGYMETFPLVNPVMARYIRWTYEGRTDGATIGSVWEMHFLVGEPPAAPAEVAEEAPAVEEAAPAAAEEAPPAPAPAVTAPTPAPRTADPITIIAIGAVVSAAGVIIAKKRK